MGTLPERPQRIVRAFPAKLFFGYLVGGLLYILLSDQVLLVFVRDTERLTQLQSYKGWAFILVTAGLLYLVVKSFTDRVARAEDEREAAAKQLERSLETQRILVGELDHRVRNNLASLVALIEIGSRDTSDVREFARTITGRVQAMALAYAMVADARWRPLPVGVLLGAITGFARERRTLEGPEVCIGPDQIVPFMLVVHELASNASEHGALSVPKGTLAIRWSADATGDGTQLRLTWTESGGPVVAPAELGTGLAMAKGMAQSELRGSLEIQMPPTGIQARLEVVIGQYAVTLPPAPKEPGMADVPSRQRASSGAEL